jgi:hypothetical protein
MSDSLNRVHERLAWAGEHLDRFDMDRHAFLQGDPYSIRREVKPNGITHDFFVDSAAPVPLALSLIAGDFLHNARAALDNLAYALCEAHTTGFDPEAPAFPIFDDPATYRKSGAKYIINADAQAQAITKGLQPYNPTPKAFPEYPTVAVPSYSPDRHPLRVLYVLSNADKHRLPNLAIAKVAGHFFNIPDMQPRVGGHITVSPSTHPLEMGTHMGQFVHDIDPRQSGVQVQPEWIVGVAFRDDPARVWGAHTYMRGILDYIRDDVLPPLVPFL